MKSALCICAVLSLSVLTGAIPTTSSRPLRVPLQRRPRNAHASKSAHSSTSEQFLGGKRVANLISYTERKYANTFAAYERNTGSCHPLDTRSRSSASLSKRASNGTDELDNQEVELWYGDLTIGTPPQNFTVDFDTGSADLFVPHTLCKVTCEGHRKYEPSLSSTSRNMKKPFFLAYGSGEVVGLQFEDTVDVGGYQITKQRFGGALAVSDDFSAANFRPDGLAGLAFERISSLYAPTVMQHLNDSGQLHLPVFGFLLSTVDGKSELNIGDVDQAAFNASTLVSVPVTPVAFWQVNLDRLSSPNGTVDSSLNTPAIIDTGTTLILAQANVVNDYFSGIPGAVCTANSFCTVPCATINGTAPTLRFGGRDFAVSPDTWNLGPVSAGSTDCIAGLGINPLPGTNFTIVGDVFLRNVYSIFDFGYPPKVQFSNLV